MKVTGDKDTVLKKLADQLLMARTPSTKLDRLFSAIYKVSVKNNMFLLEDFVRILVEKDRTFVLKHITLISKHVWAGFVESLLDAPKHDFIRIELLNVKKEHTASMLVNGVIFIFEQIVQSPIQVVTNLADWFEFRVGTTDFVVSIGLSSYGNYLSIHLSDNKNVFFDLDQTELVKQFSEFSSISNDIITITTHRGIMKNKQPILNPFYEWYFGYLTTMCCLAEPSLESVTNVQLLEYSNNNNTLIYNVNKAYDLNSAFKLLGSLGQWKFSKEKYERENSKINTLRQQFPEVESICELADKLHRMYREYYKTNFTYEDSKVVKQYITEKL